MYEMKSLHYMVLSYTKRMSSYKPWRYSARHTYVLTIGCSPTHHDISSRNVPMEQLMVHTYVCHALCLHGLCNDIFLIYLFLFIVNDYFGFGYYCIDVFRTFSSQLRYSGFESWVGWRQNELVFNTVTVKK